MKQCRSLHVVHLSDLLAEMCLDKETGILGCLPHLTEPNWDDRKLGVPIPQQTVGKRQEEYWIAATIGQALQASTSDSMSAMPTSALRPQDFL